MTARTRDSNLAEEVSQEAMMRLALEIRAGRRPDNVGAWLARVAFNVVTSLSRRRQVAARHTPQLVPPLARSPEDLAIQRERFRTMHRAFGELGPLDRRILLLAASGHEGGEIALRTGTTHAAVRARICRLRARLHARLAELEVA